MSTYDKLGTKVLTELPLVPTNFSYNPATALFTWQNNNTDLPASGYTNELQIVQGTEWIKLADVALSATTAPITGYTATTSTKIYKTRVGVRKTAGFVYPSLPHETMLQGSRIFAAGATANIPKQYGLWSNMTLTASGDTSYGGTINDVVVVGDYVYVAGATTNTIRKYNLSDLTYTGVESISLGGTVHCMITDGTYIILVVLVVLHSVL